MIGRLSCVSGIEGLENFTGEVEVLRHGTHYRFTRKLTQSTLFEVDRRWATIDIGEDGLHFSMLMRDEGPRWVEASCVFYPSGKRSKEPVSFVEKSRLSRKK